jgi:hypothetical protein
MFLLDVLRSNLRFVNGEAEKRRQTIRALCVCLRRDDLYGVLIYLIVSYSTSYNINYFEW